jgi:hypothetical protein
MLLSDRRGPGCCLRRLFERSRCQAVFGFLYIGFVVLRVVIVDKKDVRLKFLYILRERNFITVDGILV